MQKYQNLITALLIVVVCILGFITYQQQNYIESLHEIVQKSTPPSKNLLKKVDSMESSISDLESNLLDLDGEIDNLNDIVTRLEDDVDGVDSFATVNTYDIENRINTLESDLYYLRRQLNRY